MVSDASAAAGAETEAADVGLGAGASAAAALSTIMIAIIGSSQQRKIWASNLLPLQLVSKENSRVRDEDKARVLDGWFYRPRVVRADYPGCPWGWWATLLRGWFRARVVYSCDEGSGPEVRAVCCRFYQTFWLRVVFWFALWSPNLSSSQLFCTVFGLWLQRTLSDLFFYDHLVANG